MATLRRVFGCLLAARYAIAGPTNRIERFWELIGRHSAIRFDQTMRSFIRPASLIMFWFHGGSQTRSTSAS